MVNGHALAKAGAIFSLKVDRQLLFYYHFQHTPYQSVFTRSFFSITAKDNQYLCRICYFSVLITQYMQKELMMYCL